MLNFFKWFCCRKGSQYCRSFDYKKIGSEDSDNEILLDLTPDIEKQEKSVQTDKIVP